MNTAWQNPEVARHFIEERRAAVPYGTDQLTLMVRLVEHFRREPARVLDLGCGDGLLARALLGRFPNASAVLVDHSEPMLDQARACMAGYGSRVTIYNGDLAQALGVAVGSDPFDAIVSGYAIHHLPDERKRSLYAEIFQLLAAGGVFVNVEHVQSATPRGEALWDRLMVEHLAHHSGRPQEQVAAEYHGRLDRADNILAPLETQLAWLREIGFAEVDCYFKWLELAVFAGVRPPVSAAG